jgi:ribonuclease HI
MMMLWSIWPNRNNTIWNQKSLSANEIYNMAQRELHEWQTAQHHKKRGSVHTATQHVQHVQFDYVCNVDASFDQARGSTSFGCCLRDMEGNFVAAYTGWCPAYMRIYEGEAYALLEAMNWIRQRGHNRVLFQSDSQVLTNAIMTNIRGMSEFHIVILNIRQLMIESSFNFEVKFLRWQANMAVHYLARASISYANRHLIDYAPPCILPYLNEIN